MPAPNGALNQQVYLSKVLENEKITADGHFQDTRKIVLDLAKFDNMIDQKNKSLFDPGDIIMILPKNDETTITQLIQSFNLDPA